MRQALGLAVAIFGVLFAVYMGIWVMFVGGIIGIVGAIQATPVDGMEIALGILRILFSGFVGGITAYLGILLGCFVGGVPLSVTRRRF